jgi:hypothetical protein
VRSPWREVALAFHQLLRALEPPRGLRTLLAYWNHWAAHLREAPRKRRSQAQRFCETS